MALRWNYTTGLVLISSSIVSYSLIRKIIQTSWARRSGGTESSLELELPFVDAVVGATGARDRTSLLRTVVEMFGIKFQLLSAACNKWNNYTSILFFHNMADERPSVIANVCPDNDWKSRPILWFCCRSCSPRGWTGFKLNLIPPWPQTIPWWGE